MQLVYVVLKLTPFLLCFAFFLLCKIRGRKALKNKICLYIMIGILLVANFYALKRLWGGGGK